MYLVICIFRKCVLSFQLHRNFSKTREWWRGGVYVWRCGRWRLCRIV